VIVLQISDPHIGATWGEGDTAARLATVVAAIAQSGLRADALLVTGDLADHGTTDEYETVKRLLAPLDLPLHVLPGNHDDRATMRRCFGAPGDGDEPVQYAVDVGRTRLVVVDTQRPGHDDGELDEQRLGFLEEQLADGGDAPTLLAMHHPPVVTGVAGWDEFGLASPGRERLAALLAGRRPAPRIVAGHVHCTLTGDFAGCPVLAIPSTYVQARPLPGFEQIEFFSGPSAFAVHSLVGDELASYLVPVVLGDT
jgi:Icc protein